MPSSYTTSLRLTLPATGELSGTWGTTVNTGITELTDAAIAGYVSIAMTDADYTLTVANGATDQARRMMINMTGTLTAARNVICPTASKLYVIKNSTTGGYAITLKTSAGTGISIPNGKAMLLMCDGTNVVDAVTNFSSLTLGSPLLPASGGTGLTALGTGVATWLGTPSSANLAAAVTDETGSGALVFATSPTLVTPALGTPSSAVLTNATGLPISTGVSGLGANVATFLGTPSSANLAAAVTDETGSGALVFGTSPTLSSPTITGTGTAAFGNLSYTGTLTGGTGVVNLGSGQFYKDASGNVGIGTIPSAWQSIYKAFDIGNSASIWTNTSLNNAIVSNNVYINSAGNFVYKTSSFATGYSQNELGQHRWLIAPTGTAGNTFSFTAAMTLDSSGNLGLGVAPSAWVGSGNMQINGNIAFQGGFNIASNAYFGSGSVFRYINTAAASSYSQVSGIHYWYGAASGTAGNTVSFATNMSLDQTGLLTLQGTASQANLRRFSADNLPYFFNFIKSRGTVGAPTTVVLNDTIGQLQFYGNNGTNEQAAAAIIGRVSPTGTVSATSMPGQLEFYTTPDGSNSPLLRATLDSSGNLGIGTASPGTKLQVNVATSGTTTVDVQKLYDNDTGLSLKTGLDGTANRLVKFSVDPAGTGFVTAYQFNNSQHQFWTNNTERMRLDASGNLGVGTAAPNWAGVSTMLSVNGASTSAVGTKVADAGALYLSSGATYSAITELRAQPLSFGTNNTERARITSGGDLLVGTTDNNPANTGISGMAYRAGSAGYLSISSSGNYAAWLNREGSDGNVLMFGRATNQVGSVAVTATATAYNTSSDYRLKDNPQPLTNSGAFIDALQPKTWNWKVDGSKGVGFIAHEAQAVSPSSVVGEKDAVDEDGKPVMQAMEYGSAEFIANIIAELQSLRARVAALEAN